MGDLTPEAVLERELAEVRAMEATTARLLEHARGKLVAQDATIRQQAERIEQAKALIASLVALAEADGWEEGSIPAAKKWLVGHGAAAAPEGPKELRGCIERALEGQSIAAPSANLGCATTRELIAELSARAEVSATVGETWPNYRTIDEPPPTERNRVKDCFQVLQRLRSEYFAAGGEMTRDEAIDIVDGAIKAPGATAVWDVKRAAMQAIEDDRFRAAVEAEKQRIVNKRSLWDRLFPWVISIRRKECSTSRQ